MTAVPAELSTAYKMAFFSFRRGPCVNGGEPAGECFFLFLRNLIDALAALRTEPAAWEIVRISACLALRINLPLENCVLLVNPNIIHPGSIAE